MQITNKIKGSGLAGLGLLLILGLFTPWAMVSCTGPDGQRGVLLEQRGIDTISGAVSPGESLKKLAGDKANSEFDGKGTDPAWWLLLFPLGALLAMAGGGQLYRGKQRGGSVAIVGASLALVALILAVAIPLPMKKNMEEEQAAKTSDGGADGGDNPMANSLGKDIEFKVEMSWGYFVMWPLALLLLAWAVLCHLKSGQGVRRE